MAGAVHVGRQEGSDASVPSMAHQGDPLGIVQGLSVVHEPAPIPGAECSRCDVHRQTLSGLPQRGAIEFSDQSAAEARGGDGWRAPRNRGGLS